MIITVYGVEYTSDQYGSVYEMMGSTRMHVGKLYNETLQDWLDSNLRGSGVGTETDSELYG